MQMSLPTSVAAAVAMLGFDPFTYLVTALLAILVWTYCTAVGSFSLHGPGVWLRRSALLVASAGVILFAYTVRNLA